MQAIGLVPWVRRTAIDQAVKDGEPEQIAVGAGVEVEAVEPAPLIVGDTVEALGHSVLFTGELSAALLLIFDIKDIQSNWPLNKADDALLDGMLRAIGMSKASVCCCVFVQSSNSQSQSLSTLCQAPRKHFLYFGGDAIAEDTSDPIPMAPGSISGGADGSLSESLIGGWRLPPLATLRAEPARKRQAWITLKQLRSALDHN